MTRLPRARVRRALLSSISAGFLLAAAPGSASETVTYSYDALGRLIQVSRSGTVNNGASETYSYDPANNRSNVTVSSGPVPPSFSINDVSVTEGGNLVFTVTKTGTTSTSYSVNYATANGTATAGSDYNSASNTLTFLSTDTTKTVTVTTIDDTTVESSETVLVNLSNPTGGATISDSQGVGTINDNDGNQPPVANFDDAGSMTCGDAITVNVVANDTDPEGNYPLSLVSAFGGSGISVSVASSTSIQIISSGSSSGTKDFNYVVQDSLGAQANGAGTINVLAPCEGPSQ